VPRVRSRTKFAKPVVYEASESLGQLGNLALSDQQADTMQDEPPAEFVVDQDPIAQTLLPEALEHGVLIPLKTTLELRDDHTCTTILITRAPVKCANPLIT
jgi:hypothetical protein